VFFETAQRIFEFITAESGALLLTKNLYLPFLIGIPLTALVLPVLYFAPETLQRYSQHDDREDPSLPATDTSNERGDTPGESFPSTTESAPLLQSTADSDLSTENVSILPPPHRTTSRTCPKARMLDIAPLVRYLQTPRVLPIFLVYFIEVLDRGTYAHIVQYMSNLFGCTIAEAARVASIAPLFTIVVLGYIVPHTTSYLQRRSWSKERIDTGIITASLVATAVGNLIIATCNSWPGFTLGTLDADGSIHSKKLTR
jgi:hypothetical protein